MSNIERMSPKSGRTLKEDNSVINIADTLESINTNISNMEGDNDDILTALQTLNTNILNLNRDIFGTDGFEKINDTVLHTAPTGYEYYAIVPIEDSAVINTTTALGQTGNINGNTLSKDSMIVGRWSAITLTSGKIIAYKRVV